MEHDLFGKPASTFPDHALKLATDQPVEAASAASGAAQEPCWDLIELLFFAYRDFVGDPDEVTG